MPPGAQGAGDTRSPWFLEHVREVGAYFRAQLEQLKDQLKVIREVRGEGLMLAAELFVPGSGVVRQALQAGAILNCTQEKVLRFLPPLIIERRHVDEFMSILKPILTALPIGSENE